MIPLPFWLSNIQFVISAFGVFAFFAAAWLNVDAWAVRREFKTGLRAVGFFLLAFWSALHGIGLIGPIFATITALILIGGVAATTAGYFAEGVPLQPKDLAQLRRRQKPDPASADDPALMRSGEAAIEKIKLKSQAALNLSRPARAPFWARPLNIIVGLIIIVIVAALIFTWLRIFSAKTPDSRPPPSDELVTPASPTAELEESPVAEEEPTPESEPTPDKEADLPKITVTATETGFLNVREGASTTHEILTTVAPGDVFTLLEETDKWSRIQVDGNTVGWVSNRYVTKE